MDTLQALTKARATITPRENWVIGTRRRPNMRDGYAYCALGVLDYAYKLDGICSVVNQHTSAVQVLAMVLTAEEQARVGIADGWNGQHDWAVAKFNNNSSHEQVLAWFDRAIERQRMIDSMAAPQGVEPCCAASEAAALPIGQRAEMV